MPAKSNAHKTAQERAHDAHCNPDALLQEFKQLPFRVYTGAFTATIKTCPYESNGHPHCRGHNYCSQECGVLTFETAARTFTEVSGSANEGPTDYVQSGPQMRYC